jgi:hypothetical protein
VIGAARRSSAAFAAAANFSLRFFPVNSQALLLFTYFISGSLRRRLFYQQIRLNFEEETNEVLHFEGSLYDAETWTLRKIDLKYLESFAMLWKDGDQLGRSCG